MCTSRCLCCGVGIQHTIPITIRCSTCSATSTTDDNATFCSWEQQYTVVCEHDQYPLQCHVVCHYCQVCIHMYTCICLDFIINHTICKHIHLVSFNELRKPMRRTSTEPMGAIEPPIPLPVSDDNKLRKVKDRLHQLISKIHIIKMEACKSEHDLLMAESHARSAVCILELSTSSDQKTLPFPSMSNLPNNTKLQTQRFHSTRKRRKQHTTRLTKPSQQQKLAILKHLSENKSLYEAESTILPNTGKMVLDNNAQFKVLC